MRATNRTGKWAGTQVRRKLAKLLNVKYGEIAFREHLAYPRQVRASYKMVIYRKHFRVEKLKGTRFKPSKNRPNVGTLRFKAYGKKQIFRPGLVIKGRFYLLKRGRRPRRVHGSWLNADYLQSLSVKEEIIPRWLAEFDRQMRLAKTRRRRRV